MGRVSIILISRLESGKICFFLPSSPEAFFSFVIEHTEGNLPQPKDLEPSSPHKLDHVVINTNDADGFIEIYQDIFNIRLALDKVIEHWQKECSFLD